MTHDAGSTSQQRCPACIVTYNPDIALLESNIAAIQQQVDSILVFDNGSANTDELVSLLEKQHVPIELCLSQTNNGLATALNALCSRAAALGYDFALLLDQDSVASPDMVEHLFSSMRDGCAIACPLRHDPNAHLWSSTEQGTYEVKRAITSGSLLRLEAWESVGGYDEHLFVDWVDCEFCEALLVGGWHILQCTDAVLLHEIGQRDVAFRIPSRVDGKWTLKPILRYNHPIFRRKDVVRSCTYTIRRYRNLGYQDVAQEERRQLLVYIYGRTIAEKSKFAMVKAFIEGAWEGMHLPLDEPRRLADAHAYRFVGVDTSE